MQSHYPFAFERDMGCTADELRGWLPQACGARAIDWHHDGATIALDAGTLTLRWRALPPRRIALLVLPRLHVVFEARGVEEQAWKRFMRHFDLFTQRGGG
jgi:hypothetical protein